MCIKQSIINSIRSDYVDFNRLSLDNIEYKSVLFQHFYILFIFFIQFERSRDWKRNIRQEKIMACGNGFNNNTECSLKLKERIDEWISWDKVFNGGFE